MNRITIGSGLPLGFSAYFVRAHFLLELADPEFYKMGFVRSMRAYEVEFREGPNGFGVYASRDIEPSRRARVVMEIPLELMLTISQNTPWMFFPDIIPVGHPIFDIINSTNPETDWDLRMACLLLLYAFDHDKNFWQLYGDFLPSAEECTSLLLATEDDLKELHDENLASTMRKEKAESHGILGKELALSNAPEIRDANMFAPYADMLNHSCQPNCFFHWRIRDQMFEVMTNAGQRIKKGEEMTINCMRGEGERNNMLTQRYGLSAPSNPWDVIPFSGNAKIHLILDSFLSVFNISGSHEDYYHNTKLANEGDTFVDGAV
nr:protein plastid transcriptionally active 14 isoform X1 [Tanacetum cinerariifolium]